MIGEIPTATSPAAAASYAVVPGHLSSSDGQFVLDVGAQHGLVPGHGVYRAGLIGVIDTTTATSSTVRLLGFSDAVVSGVVTFEDPAAPDLSGVGTLGGSVRSGDGELVFVPERIPSEPERVVGGIVGVAGDPGRLLQPKVPIAAITALVETDAEVAFALEAPTAPPEGDVSVIVPGGSDPAAHPGGPPRT